jgi:hypothetical protein
MAGLTPWRVNIAYESGYADQSDCRKLLASKMPQKRLNIYTKVIYSGIFPIGFNSEIVELCRTKTTI